MWDTSDPDTILIDYELLNQEMGEVRDESAILPSHLCKY